VTRAIAAAAVTLSLPAAGCGGSPARSGVAHLGSTTASTSTSSSRDPMAEAIKFATCMRTHGVLEFPDPRTSATGNVMLSVPDSPKAKAAQHTCRRFLPGWGTPPASEQAQRLAALLKYARCMRTHGVTKFPDPDSAGSFPSSVNQIDRRSPFVRAAQKACQPVAGGFIRTRP
jgi:hypothetical protein